MLPLLAVVALAHQDIAQINISCRRIQLSEPLKMRAEKRIAPRTAKDPTLLIVASNEADRLLQAQLQSGKARTITAPLVRTLSGQEAILSIATADATVQTFKLTPILRSDDSTDLNFSIATDETRDGQSRNLQTLEGRVGLRRDRTLIVLEPTAKGAKPVVTVLRPQVVEH